MTRRDLAEVVALVDQEAATAAIQEEGRLGTAKGRTGRLRVDRPRLVEAAGVAEAAGDPVVEGTPAAGRHGTIESGTSRKLW